MPISTLKIDHWLGKILGRAVYQLILPPPDVRDAPPGIIEKFVAVLDEIPSFAYCKVPTTCIDTVTRLTRCGFVLVDTNVVFTKTADNQPPDRRCRLATPEDQEAIASIAANEFVFTRFHLDPQIEITLAQKIKSEWTRSFFLGKRGDKMLVAEVNDQIVGFNQLLRNDDGSRVIDLIGVKSDYRGQGLGRALCLAAENFADGERKMIVGTQIANVPSIRMYESLGYRLINSSYIFHRHNQ